MSTIRGSAHYEGLLQVEPLDEPPPLRPTILENDPFPNQQPSLRKRASRALSRFLAIFCVGVGTTLAWQSYGDAAREMIANSYPQLGWLAPRPLSTAQNAPGMVALATPAAPSFDQQSVDRIVAGHDHIMRSIDQIANRITADHEQITRSIDQNANGIAAGQEEIARSIDQIAKGIAAGQEQTTRSTDQTATSGAQAPSGKTIDITVESRADEASLHPTARLDIEPTEARPPQTWSETGKQPPAASELDPSCFPSASAVVQHHPGGWPSWTLRAPGHGGTTCWYASARPRHRAHRSEIMPRRETVGATEKGLFAPAALYAPPPLSYSRAPWLSAPPALYAPPALSYAEAPGLFAPPARSYAGTPGLFAPPARSYAGTPGLSAPPALSHTRPPE
jgi:hypothetical protein